MLLLGFLLAYRVILNCSITWPHFWWWLLGSAWATGALSLSIRHHCGHWPSDGYKRKDACWLNWSDGSKPLLAFVVPALTIVAVNLVVVLLVLTKLRRPAVGRLAQDHKATVMRIGEASCVLTPLLGLTWGFGMAAMVDGWNLGCSFRISQCIPGKNNENNLSYNQETGV